MSNMYEDFLNRLREYRQGLDMTQEEASAALGMTQSQFSKMEMGKNIFPYDTLVLLMRRGWDMDYLFTGKEQPDRSTRVVRLFEDLEEEKKRALLTVINWALRQGISKSKVEIDREIKCELDILNRSDCGMEKESILYVIRRGIHMAQIPMSEKLGVNIKKYRMLEKRSIEPDAELLLRIYEATGCRPSLFLLPEEMEVLIVAHLWSRIEPSVGAELLTFVEQAAALLG